MSIKNSDNQYGIVTIFFHWVMAILIIGLLALGLYMTDLPSDPTKFMLYGWHKEFGVIVLGLALIRVLWRFINITPLLNLPWWEKLAAQLMHWALYGFMLAMPITGWLMSSAGDHPISFFGLFTMPKLIGPDERLKLFFGGCHEWIAYALIAAILLHVIAAFKHHLIDKDNILQRIISRA